MPCQFISSCFYLDIPWAKSDNCNLKPANAEAQPGPDPVINQAPQPIVGGPPGPQVGPGDPVPAVNPLAANVEAPQARNGVEVVSSTSPNGTPDKAAKARAAKTFRAYLPSQCHRTYSCVHCRAHLANHDELISKSFQGSQGRAYLFNSVVNIGCGQAEERVLLTGLHAVADIYCDCCKTVLGWKYEQAYESSQKYKEGKFIIELAHMIKENGWENES